MALEVTLQVGHQIIGYASLRRIEGEMGEECTYTCFLTSAPNPVTGEALLSNDVVIKHHYNDGSWSLIQKLLEKVLEKKDE